MSGLAFIDTETLGLDPDVHPIWEIGLIIDGEEHCWQLPVTEREISLAHPVALEMTRFSERYDRARPFPLDVRVDRWRTMERVIELIGDRHLVGAVPSFDEERLRRLAWSLDLSPRWHYHLVDVEALAIGYLASRGELVKEGALTSGWAVPDIRPPWKSDQLTAALGLTIPDEDKHTALGDARWAKAIYERVMGAAS